MTTKSHDLLERTFDPTGSTCRRQGSPHRVSPSDAFGEVDEADHKLDAERLSDLVERGQAR